MPTIYHIRHGETDWNAAGRLQGWQDLAMNAKGLVQAAAAGKLLRNLFAGAGRAADDFDYVSSPMIRATATMRVVRTELGLPVNGFACDDRLREISYGEWEGLTMREMQARDPARFAERTRDKWETAPPAGESYAALMRRVAAWYAGVTKDTIVAAHGGTTRVLMVITGVSQPTDAADSRIEQGAVYVFADGGLRIYS